MTILALVPGEDDTTRAHLLLGLVPEARALVGGPGLCPGFHGHRQASMISATFKDPDVRGNEDTMATSGWLGVSLEQLDFIRNNTLWREIIKNL